MAKSRQEKKQKKGSKSASTAGQLDIVFAGPLLFVPSVTDGSIAGLEVFAPRNGHPIGAVFLPGVLFSDTELDDPKCKRWPEPEAFTLLDPHSYHIELTQSSQATTNPLPVTAIPESNHKVKPGRRLSSDWDVSVIVSGQISGWTSHRLAKVTEGFFHGADAPKSESVASLQRLSYVGVENADLFGAAKEPRDYLQANISKGGTLLIIGEVPYQSSLLHERQAINALAKLAGLELHLTETAPTAYRTRLMTHIMICGLSTILA